MPNRRRLFLFVCLALTLGATVWASKEDGHAAENVVLPVSTSDRDTTAQPRQEITDKRPDQQPSGLELDKLQRARMAVNNQNPFGAKSWYVPPPPPPSSSATPEVVVPTAPPLPFIYQGKLEEDPGRWAIYLLKGEQLFVVHKGEVFDNTYRLVGIENGNLVIQYMPLSVKQRLPIGGEY
jgi:hypothetical protein